MSQRDAVIRAAAFAWLNEQRIVYGDTLPYTVLASGFEFEGVRILLVGPQGIFKPAALSDAPLTIMTAPPKPGREAPYDDELTPDGRLIYKYRGVDPMHPDNVGLRRAFEQQIPLIYLFGVATGEYVVVAPVFVVGDDPASLSFRLEMEADLTPARVQEAVPAYGERSYATRTTLQRLHQARFRRQVIAAYSERCAICRLRRTELLDAAHILPDRDPRSLPIVPNGLSLCTLHHPAYDRHLIGVTPDLTVEVRRDLLDEIDGPMLIHGLQGFQGTGLEVPRSKNLRPNRDFLAERYELFRKAV